MSLPRVSVSANDPPCWWRRRCCAAKPRRSSMIPREWLFTDEALQQATAQPVAAHRARRLSGAVVHDATCSIGTELAALRSSTGALVGSDVDPVRLAMARHNVADVDLCRADALRPVTASAVVLLDPARRSAGRRRFDPRDYTPGLDTLLDVYRGRDIAVKCAPGIDFDAVAQLGFTGEIEVTSSAGGVREACLWSAGLADPGVTRRASMLDTGEEITDAEPDDCVVAQRRPVDRRPRWRGRSRGSGAPLRDPTRSLATRPRHRLPVRGFAADRSARLRGARGARLQRTPTAPGAFGS